MQRLKTDQRSKVRNFVQWTQQTEQVALSYLTRAGWNVEVATEMYYENPQMFNPLPPAVDRNRLDRFFAVYASNPEDDNDPKRIGPHGVLQLLNDLKLDPMDRRVLVLAFKLKASTQCEFSQEEWLSGMAALSADKLETLRDRLDALNTELDTDRTKFRELYNFTFAYGKQASQRNLHLDTAIAYWRILFGNRFSLFDKWEQFLREEHKATISRDTWNLFLDFLHMVRDDLSDYDEDGAWPVLLDQFVEYARDKFDLPKKPGQGNVDEENRYLY